MRCEDVLSYRMLYVSSASLAGPQSLANPLQDPSFLGHDMVRALVYFGFPLLLSPPFLALLQLQISAETKRASTFRPTKVGGCFPLGFGNFKVIFVTSLTKCGENNILAVSLLHFILHIYIYLDRSFFYFLPLPLSDLKLRRSII